MKKNVIRLLVCATALAASGVASALTCQSDDDGSWNDSGIWSCNRVPTSSDTVVIRNGHTVSLNVNTAAIQSLTINSGGVLQNTGTRTLNLAGNLTVTGTGLINLPNSTLTLAANSQWSGTATGTAISLAAINMGGRDLTFSSTASYTISLSGATPLSNHGSFNDNGANKLVTIQMSGANQAWEVYNTIYPQLQISGSGTKTYNASSIVILGNLTIDAGTTFNVTAATSSSNAVGGNLVRNGTFTTATGSGTWTFNGTSPQTIAGGVSFYRMVVNNGGSGVYLSNGNLAIGSGSSGSLQLTGGNVITGSGNKVTVSTPCNNNLISGSGWINGNLQLTFPGFSATCTYPIGDNTVYAPVTINLPYSGGIAGVAGLTLTARTTGTEHPSIASSGLNATRSVNRYWTLGDGGDTFGCVPPGGDSFNPGRYTATFQFAASDRDPGSTPANFKVGRFFGGWATPAASGATATTTSIEVLTTAGTASFGTFAIGEQSGAPSGTGPSNACSNLSPLADWRMDEASWNGTNGEVKDSSGYGYHGTAAYANGSGPRPTTASSSKAYTLGTQSTCSYGAFDSIAAPVRTYTYVGLPATPALPQAFTFTAWIRSTNVAASGQRILVNDDAQNGWGFSLGDGGSGTLRLFNRNINNSGSVSGGVNGNCGVFCLDTNSVIANNTWYFVAAAVDTVNQIVTLYVINTSGAVLAQASSAFSGNWINGSGIWAIGGETAASGEGTQSGFHFLGNIDEVGVYPGALAVSAVQSLRSRVRTCPDTLVNHYELRLPANSLACVPNTVTVAACADSAIPCSSYVNTIGGQTAVLSTSAGTLASTTVTFDGAGLATTLLTHPSATDNSAVTVTLSNETAPAQTARACCVGSSCAVANSCATTFNTAGFVVSTVPNGISTNISSQIAGVSRGYYLRAVRTNTSTKACEAALQGNKNVEFAYECDGNPSTCNNTVSMTVAGNAAAQAIGRNSNDSVTTYQPINLTFDADGNAPFTMNYFDVGQLRLWIRKVPAADTPGLLTTLSMTSNPFVVKPYDFGVTALTCSGSSTPNPAAADANGAKFCPAGDPFSLTVSARAYSGSTSPGPVTPSFGRCDGGAGGAACALETVALTHTLVAPVNGVSGNLGGTKSVLVNQFANGAYSFSNLDWDEVGIMSIQAENGNYLSNNLGTCSTQKLPGENCRGTFGSSGNAGRFYPKYFSLKIEPQAGCAGFVYAGHVPESGAANVLTGQPFTVTATAKSSKAVVPATNPPTTTTTTNYYRITPPTTGAPGFAKNINLTLAAGGGPGGLYVDATPGGNNAIPAAKFAAGIGSVKLDDASGRISYVFSASTPDLTVGPTVLTLHADDVDTATSASTGDASITAMLGRLYMVNAFGVRTQNLEMPVQALYWTNRSWMINTQDSCTLLRPANFQLSNALTTILADTTVTAGRGVVQLRAPNPEAAGFVDIAANLGATGSGNDRSCLNPPRGGTPAALPWLRSRNGNNANCPNGTYDRDPSARASFGLQTPESQRLIHVRERFF